MFTFLLLQFGLMNTQRQYGEVGLPLPCDTEAWKDLGIGLTLEYVFGRITSHALEARDSAKLCLGDQSLSFKLR